MRREMKNAKWPMQNVKSGYGIRREGFPILHFIFFNSPPYNIEAVETEEMALQQQGVQQCL